MTEEQLRDKVYNTGVDFGDPRDLEAIEAFMVLLKIYGVNKVQRINPVTGKAHPTSNTYDQFLAMYERTKDEAFRQNRNIGMYTFLYRIQL